MTAPLRKNGLLVKHRISGCESKRRYADEMTARAMGQHQIEHYNSPALWIYPCGICRGWHLTRNDSGPKNNVMYGEIHELRHE